MTDYTEIRRMPITWVVLAALLALVAAADPSSKPDVQGKAPLPAAALTMARALHVDSMPGDGSGPSGTQEVQFGDATLIIRRRPKTPHSFASPPKPVYITSAPMNIKTKEDPFNGRSGRKIELGADGIPVVHGVRTPDDEADKFFTWRNARVIKNILTPYDSRDSRRIHAPTQAVPAEVVVSSSPVRQGRLVSSDVRPVLDQGVTAVRAPVLQYAHPELGAQPALTISEQQRSREPSPTAQAVVYFARDNPQDIHNDHSPYPFEPAEIMQRQHEEPALQRPYDKRYQQYELKLRPKKTVPYYVSDETYTKYNKRPQQYNNYNQQWGKETRYKYSPSEYDQVSYASFYAPEDSRPFWERLTEVIRDNVQSGVATMTDLARPVVDPIMSASQTISHNLGFGSRSGAQEKLGVVLGANTMVLPAIGLVAGGAALGLGAAAVGRYLEQSHGSRQLSESEQVESRVEEESRRVKRALLTGGRPIASFQDSNNEHRYMDNILHGLENSQDSFLSKLSRYGHNSWSEDTPCAKRIFCDVMTQQPEDAVILMEKKMGTFLSLVNQSVARALSDHMSEVMDAVRRRDCSAFYCTAQTEERQAISGAAIEAPGYGPR